MRRNVALGLLLPMLASVGACFEEAMPVDETGAMQSSGEGCTPGTEGCPCIDGSCIDDLACLSSVCVDPGTASDETQEPATTSATAGTTDPDTTSATTSPMTSDEGPADEGPMTSDSGSDLPQGSPCDPFSDLCAPGLGCMVLSAGGLVCGVPGTAGQTYPCEMEACGTGFLCMQSEVVSSCMTEVCCTALCDLSGGASNDCPSGFGCEPLYPKGGAPVGYDHVGVCAG